MKKTAPKSKIRRPKRAFSWMNPKLEVRDTKKYGKGVFAKKDIKKNEMMAIFGGYIFSAEKEATLEGSLTDYSLQISNDLVIGPYYPEEIADSEAFNHSCNPNAGFKGQIFLVAMRNMESGEQVTFDYAMVLSRSKNRKFYKVKCLCGEQTCRGYITDNDWKNPELKKKYKGYFQWYLQEKIKNKI